MAETVSTAAKLPGKFQEYYNTLLSSLIGDSGYQEQSSAQMKNQLASALRPAYEQAKQQRALQTRANAARIDTDAAARGMGASTWVSDAKNRLQNAENADVAGINSNYISTLYQNLMDKLANQEANKLNVRQNAMNTALSATQGMYDKWLSEDSAGASGGGSSGKKGNNPRYNPPTADELTDSGYGSPASISLRGLPRVKFDSLITPPARPLRAPQAEKRKVYGGGR